MVRPAHRRPGQSRKAQYSLFVAYVIAVTGAVAGLLLAILSVADPVGFAQLRIASQELTAPIARGTRSVIGSISGIDDSVGAYVAAGSQNRRLRKELADTRRQLVATSSLQEENRQLKALLKLQQTDKTALANGYLLTSTSTSSKRIALLSIGRNLGVAAGQPVRGAETIFETSIDSSLSRTGSDDQAWSSTMRPTIFSILRSASRSSFDGICRTTSPVA